MPEVATTPFLPALAGGMQDQPGFRLRVEQALQGHGEVPGEGLSPWPPVGPWAPVMPVEMGPSETGGNSLSSCTHNETGTEARV